jgi:type II secretory pathway component PulF
MKDVVLHLPANAPAWLRQMTRARLGTRQRLEIFDGLKEMLGDGLPLDHCLGALHERKAYRGSRDAEVLGRWRNAMARGRDFGVAIEGDVPAAELVLIRAGLRANDIPAGLEQAIKVTTALRELRAAILSKMAYPALLSLVLLGALYGYGNTFVPQFERMLPVAQWPTSGRILRAASLFVVNWGALVAVSSGVLAAAVVASLPRLVGSMRRRLDRMVPWSLYRSYCSASFLIAMAALLRAGVPFSEALTNIRASASPWLTWHVDQIKARATAGKTVGDSLDTGLLDDDTTDQVYIYARVAKFDEAIKAIAERTVKNTGRSVGARLDLVRNVVLVGVGLVIGLIYVTNVSIMQISAGRMNQRGGAYSAN